MSELKPCPFCASEAEYNWTRCRVICAACGAQSEIHAAPDRAAKAWNDRPYEWRSIETAPKDKDLLLGWWRTWPERQWECAAGLAGSTKGGWLHGQATHWQPLPHPPAGTEIRQSEKTDAVTE